MKTTFFFLFLSLSFSLCSWEVSREEAESIGKQIYWNECSSNPDKLIWWNAGENFASLGIGHFIWYPKEVGKSFEEMFPSLISFFKDNNVEMPTWLKECDGCPWKTREEFLGKECEGKKKELQAFLSRTISWQAIFIALNFQRSLPDLLANLSDEKKEQILEHIEKMGTPRGKYALLDYMNFKGKGLLETERYQGKGWGLKQVLETMPEKAEDPVKSFANAAKGLLKQRIQNAPAERQEGRWLPGWLNRVDSY